MVYKEGREWQGEGGRMVDGVKGGKRVGDC